MRLCEVADFGGLTVELEAQASKRVLESRNRLCWRAAFGEIIQTNRCITAAVFKLEHNDFAGIDFF